MIGININAGFCNRIFQMIFGYTFAKKYNTSFRFENWEIPSHHTPDIFRWFVDRFMRLPNYHHDVVSYTSQYNEPHYGFTQYYDIYSQLEDISSKNILMCGYFQNEQYFKDYREDVLKLLEEPSFVTEKICTDFQEFIPYMEMTYFMHIRLGDYVHHPKHWVNLENYYIRVLEKIKEDHKDTEFIIAIFSNQLIHIPKIYPRLYQYLQGIKYILINETNEVVSFYLMSRCYLGGVCANSTYGWWAGWINTNPKKKVYMPSRWMAPDEYNEHIQIYPTDAIVVEVE